MIKNLNKIQVAHILTVGRLGDAEDVFSPGNTSSRERLEQLEHLRRTTAEGLGYVYPERLSRVFEVAERQPS